MLAVGNLLQPLSHLLFRFLLIGWVAERNHCDQLRSFGNAEQGLDLWPVQATNPARADPLTPGREHQTLGRAGGVNVWVFGPFDDQGNCQGCIGDVRPGRGEGPDLLESLALLDHQEAPGLAVALGMGLAPGLENFLDYLIRNRVRAKAADRWPGTDAVENVHKKKSRV